MGLAKKKLQMNSFFAAQFNYCSLKWMIHSCSNNNKVKCLHGRYLRLICCDKTSLYEEVLEKDGSLAEMFKIKNNMSPAIGSDTFLPWTEIITTLRNKITFYSFYTKGISCQWKFILPRPKNMKQTIHKFERRIFSKKFLKNLPNYGNLYAVLGDCVKLT